MYTICCDLPYYSAPIFNLFRALGENDLCDICIVVSGTSIFKNKMFKVKVI